MSKAKKPSQKAVRAFQEEQAFKEECRKVPFSSATMALHSGCSCHRYGGDKDTNGLCMSLMENHYQELSTPQGQQRAQAYLSAQSKAEIDAALKRMEEGVAKNKAESLAQEAYHSAEEMKAATEAMNAMRMAATATNRKAERVYLDLAGEANKRVLSHQVKHPEGLKRHQESQAKAKDLADYQAWESNLSPQARAEWHMRRATEKFQADGSIKYGPKAYYTMRLRPPLATWALYDPPLYSKGSK